jgi:hypothetical protein
MPFYQRCTCTLQPFTVLLPPKHLFLVILSMYTFLIFTAPKEKRICVIISIRRQRRCGVNPSNKASPGRSPSEPLRHLKRPSIEIGSQSQSLQPASSGCSGGCSGVRPAVEALIRSNELRSLPEMGSFHLHPKSALRHRRDVGGEW